ncbi:hypothetical protein D6C00_00990 [Thiohalobacter thiocyanaticus]|uniref:Uncharacterized protein n=1 Tax=Thiohalobacter thiocyanaticus TaxID=585455 RepID=A0A426QG27_9GAMM|nr:hypothetical protein D6C00_00990 [Thiohalobacter thiocyanaticus]
MVLDVTAARLAEMLGVSRFQVDRWHRQGMPKKRSRMAIFDVEVCLCWLAGRRFTKGAIAYMGARELGARERLRDLPISTTLFGHAGLAAKGKTFDEWAGLARLVGLRAGGSEQLISKLLELPIARQWHSSMQSQPPGVNDSVIKYIFEVVRAHTTQEQSHV